MSTLGLYLWKEWREHWRALLAVALVFAVMLAGFAWLLAPKRLLADPLFPSFAGSIAILIALLAVGGELLAERRIGGLAWLQRLPAGLATPFWMKLAFHVATTLAAGIFGLALAIAVAWMRGASQELDADLASRALFLLVALLALWTFAASSWSSRSILALFSAAFTLAGLGLPVWYLVSKGYQPELWEAEAGVGLLLAGSLPSAWLGFVTAGRFDRGPARALLLGFSTAIASFLPFWAWGAWQLHVRDRFDPLDPSFELCSAFVTSDQRTAFVEAWMWNERWDPEFLPRPVLRVNLADGSFERVLDGSTRMTPVRMFDADCRAADHIHVWNEERSGFYFYLASGAPVGAKDTLLMPHRCKERRGWLLAKAPFGDGLALKDEFTGETVHPDELALPRDAWIWSDLGIWYVISQREGAFLLDPDSGELSRAAWLDPVSFYFGPRLADGRFFAPLRDGGACLVDPAQSTVTPLAVGESVTYVYRAYGVGNRTPFGQDEVVLVRTGEETYRFDAVGQALELVPILCLPNRVVGCGRDGSVYVIVDDAGLMRVDLESNEQTLLFPRAD